MKNRFGFLCLVAGVLALAISGGAMAQGTVTGVPPLVVGNAFSVTLNVPSVVGVSWDRNVYFDLGNGAALAGSCGSYPPAPTTPTPCYWDDQATAAGVGVAAPMNIQLFANSTGAGNIVRVDLLGQGGTFGSSNADITSVFYAAGNVATCGTGAICAGYTQMSSTAATVFASTGAPTAGWATVANGRRFIFQVNPGLTVTGGPQVKTTSLTVSLP